MPTSKKTAKKKPAAKKRANKKKIAKEKASKRPTSSAAGYEREFTSLEDGIGDYVRNHLVAEE